MKNVYLIFCGLFLLATIQSYAQNRQAGSNTLHNPLMEAIDRHVHENDGYAVQRCHATEIHEATYAEDDAYRRWYDDQRLNLQTLMNISSIQQRLNCNDPIIIPVAVHYEGVSGQSLACLESLALSQIHLQPK